MKTTRLYIPGFTGKSMTSSEYQSHIRGNKYNNTKTTIDDKTFDSKKEATRYKELLSMQLQGLISDLQTQVKYELIPAYKGIQHKVSYIADFVYSQNGTIIVEDVKSYITRKQPVYVVKKKLMYHIHRIKIKEV